MTDNIAGLVAQRAYWRECLSRVKPGDLVAGFLLLGKIRKLDAEIASLSQGEGVPNG